MSAGLLCSLYVDTNCIMCMYVYMYICIDKNNISERLKTTTKLKHKNWKYRQHFTYKITEIDIYIMYLFIYLISYT